DNLVPDGSYAIDVNVRNRVHTTASFKVKSNQTHNLSEIVVPLADQAIAGVVVDPTENPLPGLKVCGFPMRPGQPHVYQDTTTDGEGRFRIRNLSKGPFRLFAKIESPGRKNGYDVRMVVEAGKEDLRIILNVPGN